MVLQRDGAIQTSKELTGSSALLETIGSGADTILVNLPAGLVIAFLKAAGQPGLGDT